MSGEIGFVGLGNMGFPMASRLLAAGCKLVVTDVDQTVLAEFEKLGGRLVKTPKDVADACETVFVSLPTPAIVSQVATGENGVSSGKAVKRFIDLSTTGSTASTRIAGELAGKGIAHLDAPVSGGRIGATAGTLAVMVSGPRDHYDLVEPLLKHIGTLFYVGEKSGLGQTMKLVNNLLSATAMAATSEAVVMAVKAGIDPATVIDVINAGSGRNSASQDKFPKAILPRSFDFGFATSLMYKDLRLCMEEAEALGAQMWVGNAVKQLWQLVHSQIGPDSDFTRIVQVPEKWAGVEVGKKA